MDGHGWYVNELVVVEVPVYWALGTVKPMVHDPGGHVIYTRTSICRWKMSYRAR